jgi:hypothetical protein
MNIRGLERNGVSYSEVLLLISPEMTNEETNLSQGSLFSDQILNSRSVLP